MSAPTVPTEAVPATGSTGSLLDALIAEGHLVATGVPGLFGRSAAYQRVAGGLSAMVNDWSSALGATRLQLPPVLARSTFARTNYLESFPDLMGSVHVFNGGDAEHKELLRRVETGGDWPSLLEPAEVVLASSACHALYPMCTGTVPEGGRWFDVTSWCFRHEPSNDSTRLQSFVMHEVVYVGSPEGAWDHRETGLALGLSMLEGLGLPVRAVPASDPFFGRVGAVLAAGQLDEQLKVEAVTRIPGTRGATAVMSANCHRDHFGRPFEIRTEDGEPAHSACVGFGVDRIVVALFAVHGFSVRDWPTRVLAELGL